MVLAGCGFSSATRLIKPIAHAYLSGLSKYYDDHFHTKGVIAMPSDPVDYLCTCMLLLLRYSLHLTIYRHENAQLGFIKYHLENTTAC